MCYLNNSYYVLYILAGSNHSKVTNENKIFMEVFKEPTGEPLLKKFKSE